MIIVFVCRNNIDDISQVEFLALCQSLANLTLEGNPLCVTPSPDEASVRGLVQLFTCVFDFQI